MCISPQRCRSWTMRFYREDEVEDKNKQASPINSDVLQGKTAVSAPVKKADSSSNSPSESKAKQPANLKHNKLLEKTKKAAAAVRKPQPVPEATQPQKPGSGPVKAKEKPVSTAPAASVQQQANKRTPENSEVAVPTAKKPAGDSVAVPRFNLAERILAEQRRFASERRRKAGPGGAAAGSYAADDTLGAVIREVKDNMARPVGAATGADGDNPAVCGTSGNNAGAAAAQKLLIADIVARDVAALCGRRRRDSLNR